MWKRLTLGALGLLFLSGCAAREFGMEEEEDAPLQAATVVGAWVGEKTWDGGTRHLRLVLELEAWDGQLLGTGELTGSVEGTLEAVGAYRAPEIQLTLQGEAYDERYILPGRLSEDGRRIFGYLRGEGVDFDLTLRRYRPEGE